MGTLYYLIFVHICWVLYNFIVYFNNTEFSVYWDVHFNHELARTQGGVLGVQTPPEIQKND
jgi:hypothetical protein